MSLRIEGIGAAAAAVSSAVGAVLDWPVAFGVAGVLAVAVTVSFFVSRRGRGAGTSGSTTDKASTSPPKEVKNPDGAIALPR